MLAHLPPPPPYQKHIVVLSEFKGGSANSAATESPAFTLDMCEIEDFYVRLKRQVVPG